MYNINLNLDIYEGEDSAYFYNATKEIHLPFAPFVGLLFKPSDPSDLSEAEMVFYSLIKIANVQWSVEESKFYCAMENIICDSEKEAEGYAVIATVDDWDVRNRQSIDI